MHYIVLVGAAMAASVLATPGRHAHNSITTIADRTLFHLTARRHDDGLQYSTITAAGRGLLVNYPEDSTSDTCKSSATPGAYTATLFLENGTLNLYTPSDSSQQFYVHLDYGLTFFMTLPGDEDKLPVEEGILTHGWELSPTPGGSELELKFKGHGFYTCVIDTKESDWDYSPQYLIRDAVLGLPDEESCRAVSLYATTAKDKPNACTYCYEVDCCKVCIPS